MKHKNTLSTLIFVLAVAFGFIYWSQNQKPKTEGSPEVTTTTTIDDSENTPPRSATTTTTFLRTTSSASLEDYLKSLDPKANWKINKASDGRVIAISGGMIPVNTKNPSEALKFAQNIAEKMGVPANQIIASNVELESTPYSTAQQFDQKLEGFEVFGGFMKVFTRVPSGEVYYIANETRNVGAPNLSINYSLSDIQEIIRRKYSDKKGLEFEGKSDKPVIFSTGVQQSELGWESTIKIAGPLYDRRHLVVSAASGKILKDTSLVQH